jgi:hypothetical protein
VEQQALRRNNGASQKVKPSPKSAKKDDAADKRQPTAKRKPEIENIAKLKKNGIKK